MGLQHHPHLLTPRQRDFLQRGELSNGVRRGVEDGGNNLPLSGLLLVILSLFLAGTFPALLLASVCDFAALFLSASKS